MLTLAHDDLTLELLDPADALDRPRLGTRFCWGGYIWQLRDREAGPLLAGPEWPKPAPTPFNGQGLPESFRHAVLGTGEPLMLENRRGFIIGIGDVAPGADDKIAVSNPCPWSVTRGPGSIEFCTQQSGNGYACALTRHISLRGRTLVSATQLTNTGSRPIPLHWFAHPFFMLTDRQLTCGLPAGWGMNENPGYSLDSRNRLHFQRRFKDEFDGWFEPLVIGPGVPLRAVLSHPKLREVVFSTDFTPDFCPVWGNSNTWSIEPYIRAELPPGAARAWTLTYEFGPAVKTPPAA